MAQVACGYAHTVLLADGDSDVVKRLPAWTGAGEGGGGGAERREGRPAEEEGEEVRVKGSVRKEAR